MSFLHELELKRKHFEELADDLRQASHKEPPGPTFNGLCLAATKYEGYEEAYSDCIEMLIGSLKDDLEEETSANRNEKETKP